MKKCDGCKGVFFGEELSEFKEEMMLCETCLENHFVCECCESDCFEEAGNVGKYLVCSACEDGAYICDGCGQLFHRDVTKMRESKRGDLLCEDCYYFEEDCGGDMYKYNGVSAKDFI